MVAMSRDNELTGSELRCENSGAYNELISMVRGAQGRPVPQGLLNILLQTEAEIDALGNSQNLERWELQSAIVRIQSAAYESITLRYKRYLSLLRDTER